MTETLEQTWTFPEGIATGDTVLHFDTVDHAAQNLHPRFAQVVKIREDGQSEEDGPCNKSLDLLVWFNSRVRLMTSVRHAHDPRHEEFPRWQQVDGVFLPTDAGKWRMKIERRLTVIEKALRAMKQTE